MKHQNIDLTLKDQHKDSWTSASSSKLFCESACLGIDIVYNCINRYTDLFMI